MSDRAVEELGIATFDVPQWRGCVNTGGARLFPFRASLFKGTGSLQNVLLLWVMATFPPSSLIRTSSEMCAELAADPGRKLYQATYRKARGVHPARARAVPEPKPEDALPDSTCQACGIQGDHSTPIDCIEALRNRLARWE